MTEYNNFININGKNIYTRRYGEVNEYNVKILVVNGGPGADFQYLTILKDYLLSKNITLYFYCQLGCYPSDNADNITDYTIQYYAYELEQVRNYFKIFGENCYIYGQSFGGMIILEWTELYNNIANSLQGIILSNTPYSVPLYEAYSQYIFSTFPPSVQATLLYYQSIEDYTNPEYVDLLNEYYNYVYLCRVVPYPLPLQATFNLLNYPIYLYMQGPNEFVITGTLKSYDKFSVLSTINTSTLCLTGIYDTVDPNMVLTMSQTLPNGVYYKTNGSHMSFYDDPENYFNSIINFINNTKINILQYTFKIYKLPELSTEKIEDKGENDFKIYAITNN